MTDETFLNVLTLGVKNDGSEDVSEIVNRYTADHAFFFPAVKYRVSRPLVIKNTSAVKHTVFSC